MHTIQRRRLLQGATAFALPAWAGVSTAAAFPTRTVKFIQPFPAGSASDTASRLLANAMESALGQSIIVENKPGGAFQLAVSAAKSAPADGYTALYLNSGMLATQAVLGQYDLFKDMAPVGSTGESDICLIGALKRGLRSAKELIEFGRANPGQLTYASPGVGTLEHLALATFCKNYGIDATHVPVKGGPEMLQLVLQSAVDFSTLAVPLLPQYLKTNQVRGLALLNETRNPSVPEVPTYVEEKLDIPRVTIWAGLAVRSNTPKEVIATLEKAVAAAAAQPAYREKVIAMGLTFGPKTASEFGKKWRDDYVWIAKAAEPFKNNLNR